MSALHMPSRGQVQTGLLDQVVLSTLLDQLPLALLSLDDEFRIQAWNRAAAELSGHSAEEVLGSRWEQELLCTFDGHCFLRHRNGHLLRVRTQTIVVPLTGGLERRSLVAIVNDAPSMCLLDHARGKRELDLIDPLTDLGNRRLAAIEFEAFLIRYQLHRREFGVALFDVDLLHQVVKRFGYECSDEALKVVARTLAACLDEHDLLCRWGGDQFLALLVGGREEAQSKADLGRRAVEWSSMEWCGEPVALTVSGGVEMGSPGDHPEDLVGRAAFRLRMSKRLGRNRVMGGAEIQAE
ncbi:MAG: sensor domain-containing diguanylate cyclase [Acidobacteriota bacterium]